MAESVPNRIRSSIWKGSLENFRMVRKGPPMASGWITALTREPSGRRASHSGVASSMRRPTWATILSMMRRRCWSSTKVALVFSTLPLRSTNTRSGPLTMTSVISSERSRRSMGP